MVEIQPCFWLISKPINQADRTASACLGQPVCTKFSKGRCGLIKRSTNDVGAVQKEGPKSQLHLTDYTTMHELQTAP